MPTIDEQQVVVGQRRVKLRHLDKVLFPETGTTKAAVIAYYAQVADAILPHLRERQVTLKRYPDGVDAQSFFEKNCPHNRPPWIKVSSRPADNEKGRTDYCVVAEAASLAWLANMVTIEFHVPLATRRSIERPRSIVFDLDPGPGTSIVECCQVGVLLRSRLAEDGFEVFPKTSGSKGLQLYVPLNHRAASFDRTKPYARALAAELAADFPELVVSNMRKSLRNGRVLIDWSQNDSHKTTVCVYSLRGRERPTCSTPVTWEEVVSAQRSGDPEELVFTIDDVVDRVEHRGDLFAEVLTMTQPPPSVKK